MGGRSYLQLRTIWSTIQLSCWLHTNIGHQVMLGHTRILGTRVCCLLKLRELNLNKPQKCFLFWHPPSQSVRWRFAFWPESWIHYNPIKNHWTTFPMFGHKQLVQTTSLHRGYFNQTLGGTGCWGYCGLGVDWRPRSWSVGGWPTGRRQPHWLNLAGWPGRFLNAKSSLRVQSSQAQRKTQGPDPRSLTIPRRSGWLPSLSWGERLAWALPNRTRQSGRVGGTLARRHSSWGRYSLPTAGYIRASSAPPPIHQFLPEYRNRRNCWPP